jgi:putative ABC transport system permease protein
MDDAAQEGVNQVTQVTMGIFTGLTGFSAIIAAVGMINNLSLSMLQRTRELGLLRALGFTGEQVRRMVLAESVQITAASVVLGLMLGVFYGWVGAVSLLGSVAHGVLVAPAIPWWIIGGLVIAAALLAAVASIAPTRYATRVSPVRALAVE